MTEQRRSNVRTSAFDLLGEMILVSGKTLATYLQVSYIEARVNFRVGAWWRDIGLDVVRRRRAQDTGKDPEADTGEYIEMYELLRQYAVRKLTEAAIRRRADYYKSLLPEADIEAMERRFIEVAEENASMRNTLIADGGIDIDALIAELSPR